MKRNIIKKFEKKITKIINDYIDIKNSKIPIPESIENVLENLKKNLFKFNML